MIPLIGGLSFAIFFVDIHKFYHKWKLNFKPFNCASCLSAWVTLLLYFMPEYIVLPFTFMFTAGVLAPIIHIAMEILFQKLK